MNSRKFFSVAEIKNKVSTSPVWAEAALVRLFNEQTPQEQEVETTVYKNSRGSNGVDAELLSSFAKQIERKAHYQNPVPEGQRLSAKQLAIAYKKLPKYAGQLFRLSYGMSEAEYNKAQKAEQKKVQADLLGERDILISTAEGLYETLAERKNEAALYKIEIDNSDITVDLARVEGRLRQIRELVK